MTAIYIDINFAPMSTSVISWVSHSRLWWQNFGLKIVVSYLTTFFIGSSNSINSYALPTILDANLLLMTSKANKLPMEMELYVVHEGW